MHAPRLLWPALFALCASAGAQEKLNAPVEYAGAPAGLAACIDGDNRTECVIELEVESPDAGSCRIKLVHPWSDLIAFGAGVRDKWIYWKIVKQPAGASFRFTLDGVAFTGDHPPRNFVGGKRGKDWISYRWKNRNKRAGVFKYAITVTDETDDEAPTRECDLDPWIRNRA